MDGDGAEVRCTGRTDRPVARERGAGARAGGPGVPTRGAADPGGGDVVTVDTYSVPFTLIGQPVEVLLPADAAGQVVATIRSRAGTSSGSCPSTPGPIARNARVRYSTGGCSTGAVPLDVEIRDLACYEAAYGLGGAQLTSPRWPASTQAAAPEHGARTARSLARLGEGAAPLDGLREEVSAKTAKHVTESGPLVHQGFASTSATSPLDRKQIQKLNFVEHGDNLVLLGPPGVGKTHLAGTRSRPSSTATGFSSRRPRRCCDAHQGAERGALRRQAEGLHDPAASLIDEIGYLPIDRQAATLFFQLISRRYERGPMILTSNQSFAAGATSSAVIASAILDRCITRRRSAFAAIRIGEGRASSRRRRERDGRPVDASPWTRRRAHRALDRPQTASDRHSSHRCSQPGGWGKFR